MIDIIEAILHGIMDILDGISGRETAANDTIRKCKNISLILGIIAVCGGVLALLIWLVASYI